jgi:hypothetical protein
MALCDYCEQDMLTAESCVFSKYEIEGESFSPVPFGAESGGWNPEGMVCHDCGVAPYAFHHPGCDVEECPRCRMQLISCDCDSE